MLIAALWLFGISNSFAADWQTQKHLQETTLGKDATFHANNALPTSHNNKSVLEESLNSEKSEEEDSEDKNTKTSFSLIFNTVYTPCLWVDYPQFNHKQQFSLLSKPDIFILNCSFLI
ncbi:hypothetical protein [Chondrinema litorale]|uniref:hypothetical protein n=1 Tax=Chondrinema litorale TaxID=2994555 RepID=UPI002543675A|nr:hypothetical protein [Chondrinema litorale]UZR97016.1 hypothetical protein OQ292_23235 [Chondrinema litorale]